MPQSVRTGVLYPFQQRQPPKWTGWGENTGVIQSPLTPALLGSFCSSSRWRREELQKPGWLWPSEPRNRKSSSSQCQETTPAIPVLSTGWEAGPLRSREDCRYKDKLLECLSPCHPHLSPFQCFNHSCHYSLNILQLSSSSWIMERRTAHREFASSSHTSTKTR